MAASDADGKRSLFRRGLNATRLALAFAVTVVILTIVVYAIVVVSRRERLTLSVAGGIIYVMPQSDPQKLGLTFSVKANNPSGRVRFYYTDIWGRVRLNNGTVTFARFQMNASLDVSPVQMMQRDANVDAIYFPKISTYFNELRNSKSSTIMTDAMLQLNGTLTVGLYSMHNKTTDHKRTFYYCYPLTIGAASNASADAAADIPCQTVDPTK